MGTAKANSRSRAQRAVKRNVLIYAVVALVMCAALAALWPRGFSAEQTLADGTAIRLTVLGIGPGTCYEGTPLQRALGRLAPAKGLQIGKLTFKPAEKLAWGLPGRADLVVRVQIVPKDPSRTSSPRGPQRAASNSLAGKASGVTNHITTPWLPGPSARNRPFRGYSLSVAGDNGTAYGGAEFGDFHDYSNRLVVLVGMSAFPRASKHFHFRLESSDGNRWTELASFVIKNPNPAGSESLAAAKPPKPQLSPELGLGIGRITQEFKLSPELDLEIGEVTDEVVKAESTTATFLATVPFRILQRGQLVTNWGIADGQVRDALGNPALSVHNSWQTTNGWTLGRVAGAIDPSQPWRIHLDVAPWRNHPDTNLHSVYVNLPQSGTMKTNVDGFDLQVDCGPYALEIRMPTNQPGLRMKVVHVIDKRGRDLTKGSSWISRDQRQYSFRASIYPGTNTQIKVVAAIVPTYGVDFVAQPQVVESKMPGAGSMIAPVIGLWDYGDDELPTKRVISQPGSFEDSFNPPRPELVHPERTWW